jgi:hypothetical protein
MEWSEQIAQALKVGWLEVLYAPYPKAEDEWWDACTAEERPFIVLRRLRKYGFAYFDMYTCATGFRTKLTKEGIDKIEELHREYLAGLSARSRKLLREAGSRKSVSSVYGPAVGEMVLRREERHWFMPKLVAILLEENYWHLERDHGKLSIPGRRQARLTPCSDGKSSTNL